MIKEVIKINIKLVKCNKCGQDTYNHRNICLNCGAELKEKDIKKGIDERDVGSSCEGGGCPVR